MREEVEIRQPPEAGNVETVEAVFTSEGPALWRAVYAYTGGRRDLADEAVAEAFALAIEHAASIREAVPWLYRVAFRTAARELRRERKSTPVADQAEAASSDDTADLTAALRRLAPNQRAALVLFYLSDLPVAEVSRRMGISRATVKVHLHRGRRRLRQELGTEEEDG